MAKATQASTLARFILVATALLLPTLSLLPFGGLYLWEKGYLVWWALSAFISVLLVSLAQRSLFGAHTATIPDALLPNDRANPAWTQFEQKAWSDVRALAGRSSIDRISDPSAFLDLGVKTVEVVARRLHPQKDDAVWQFTLPEALAITERVSGELAGYVVDHVPFGDRMTLAQFWAVYRWRRGLKVIDGAYDVWRLIRLANPVTAMTHEARERLSRALLQWGREHVSRRITETFVDEVGRAAIDLYGGRLRVKHEALQPTDISLQQQSLAQAMPPGSSALPPIADKRSSKPGQAVSAAISLGKAFFRRRRN